MEKEEKRMLRGLFVIEANNTFDEQHPLWSTISALGPRLDEVHILVLSDKPRHHKGEIKVGESKVFIYQFSKNFLFFRLDILWKWLKYHLLWQKVFRPDFVMSFEPNKAGILAWFVARMAHRDLILHASVQAINGSFMRRFILRRARIIFVPGENTANKFKKTLNIKKNKLVPLSQPVDLPALHEVTEKYDFEKEHPEYNVFLSSVVHDSNVIRRLILVHQQVMTIFSRTALVLIVEDSMYKKAVRISKRNGKGIFVYKKSDNYLTLIKSSTIYLALSSDQDFDQMMLSALGMNVAVAPGAYGIANELFIGSPYEQFLSKPNDHVALAQTVIKLLKDQFLRNQYRLNNPIFAGKISFTNINDYTSKMIEIVDSTLRPTNVESAVLPGTHYIYTETEK